VRSFSARVHPRFRFFSAQVALKARYCAHGTTRERIKGGSFSSIDVLAIARITNMVAAFV